MNNMKNKRKQHEQKLFTGERALYMEQNASIMDSTFSDGESPLKESRHIELSGSSFRWKYPLWYSKDAQLNQCVLSDTGRAGVWYSDMVTMKNTVIEAPKTFRRSKNITLEQVSMPNASETLWMCEAVCLRHVTVHGSYFAMNSSVICADDLTLTGDYAFDGCKNVKIRNAKMLCKDAFWNCDNVTVEDSYLSGEYIGWNSKNLTFINCTIESLQGLCYIENLTLKNCKLLNTSLAFEFCSNIHAEVTTVIDSIKNPVSGIIKAKGINEIILDSELIDPSKTEIIIGEMKHAI